MKLLLDRILHLQNWTPPLRVISSSLLSETAPYATPMEVSQFIHNHQISLFMLYLKEYELCIDTLILLCYQRCTLELQQMHDLFSQLIRYPLLQHHRFNTLISTCRVTELVEIDRHISIISFKAIMLFSECCQFCLFFQTNDIDLSSSPQSKPSLLQLSQHPLLQHPSSSSSSSSNTHKDSVGSSTDATTCIDNIATLLLKAALDKQPQQTHLLETKHHHHHHHQKYHQQQKDNHDAFVLVLLFTWYAFIISFESVGNKELQGMMQIVAYFKNDNSNKLDDVVHYLLQFSRSGK